MSCSPEPPREAAHRSLEGLLARGGSPLLVRQDPRAGSADFILVRAEIEVPIRKRRALLDRLAAAGYLVVEVRSWFSHERWNRNRVRVALEEDVTRISRAELARAAAERRVLCVTGSGGGLHDRTLSFWLAPPECLPGGAELSFLFAQPLEREELPDGGEVYWETPEELFHAHRARFTRNAPDDSCDHQEPDPKR